MKAAIVYNPNATGMSNEALRSMVMTLIKLMVIKLQKKKIGWLLLGHLKKVHQLMLFCIKI